MNEAIAPKEVAAPQKAAKEANIDYYATFDFASLDGSLESLLKAGVHFGHLKSRRHPQMEQYVFTTRKNINIIDLAKTKEKLEEANRQIAAVIKAGKPVLFVGMKKQTHDTVRSIAKRLGQSFVIDRWLGGTLTNWKQIRGRAMHLKDSEGMHAAGDFKKYTKFEQAKKMEEIERLEKKVGGIKEMTEMPGIIVIADVKEAELVIHEARKMKIPLIGIVDSNANPSHIDYPIPGNDDAVSSLRLLLGYLGKAVLEAEEALKKAPAKENPVA